MAATTQGESALVICCGSPCLESAAFLEPAPAAGQPAPTGLPRTGYVGQAVQQLLEVAGPESSVTLSWFNMGCSEGEDLSDVFKFGVAAGEKETTGKEKPLRLRHLSAGRGCYVPGLTQVEISSVGDMYAVIDHVRKHRAEAMPSPAFHSVLQLTFSQDKKKARVHAKSHKRSIVATDPPGVGRLTFLMLSALSPSYPLHFSEEGLQGVFPWVEQLAQVVP